MGGASRNIAMGACGFALLLALATALLTGVDRAEATAQAQQGRQGNFLGVATCGGSTCHGRSVANTPDMGPVRQDEILIWQDPASAAGAHSRAFAVLQEPRSRQIAQRLGIAEASSAPQCIGCHATPAPASQRGPRFLRSDGVSCESCHGAASTWLTAHYSAGASHGANVSLGLVPLENPQRRAQVCLDCHFGHEAADRFVTHRLMAAGHPRISFELDLFSTLQAHHDEDPDYNQRKPNRASNVQMWAIGQAMALQRSLSLFTSPRGREGIFPEFYFLDCHSCHRQIRDDPQFDPTVVDNPARPIPSGMPPYNDENMIMLSAAARVVSPALARRFDQSSQAFHEAMSRDPAAVRAAAERLKGEAAALVNAFATAPIGRAEVFRIIDTITSNAISPRFTDYAGSVQAVMATDTLLSSLVAGGEISADAVQGIRADINAAYQAVREPNAYQPRNFRASLGRAAAAIRRLR
ncbi:MAG TPA: multiheme c-type cytochrome [Allosphingosinicella sp.]